MNFKKIALIATALLVAIAFAGCKKKPRRPNPLDTVMGGGSGQSGDYVAPDYLGDDASQFGLTPRSSSIDEMAANANSIGDIYFSFDSASITPTERGKLNDAAERLKSNGRLQMVLEGHCDWRGTSEYNLALGDRRAKSVQSFLVTLGISADRLHTLSKGDSQSTEGASSAQMAKERKVALLLVQ